MYRHERLDETFTPLIDALRTALSAVMDPHAVPIALEERKYGLRVAIVPDRDLFRSASFVLAVKADLAPAALLNGFPQQAKLGPVERIRDLVNLQLPGIALRALPVAPRQLPFHAGFTYFELERGGELWRQFATSAGVALHVAGRFSRPRVRVLGDPSSETRAPFDEGTHRECTDLSASRLRPGRNHPDSAAGRARRGARRAQEASTAPPRGRSCRSRAA